MKLQTKPICQTEGCKNEAIGVLNAKWRCGKCIIAFENKMRELKEKFFIAEK